METFFALLATCAGNSSVIGALTFSWICARINGWVNNGEAGDLEHHRAHYDATAISGVHCAFYKKSSTTLMCSRAWTGRYILQWVCLVDENYHYDDVVIGAMASQITSLTIVYSTVYSDAGQRKHQSSASLAFVRGIHQSPVNAPHKWPVTRKMFPFHDVIMIHAFRFHEISSARRHRANNRFLKSPIAISELNQT